MFQPCLKMILLLLMPVYSIGQLVVSNLYENILYIGVDNYIDYAVKTKQPATVTLTVSRGEIFTSYDRLIYRHCTYQPGIVIFYAIDKKSKKVIDSIPFRLKPLPDPRIKLITPNMKIGIDVGNFQPVGLEGVMAYHSGNFELPVKIIEYEVIIAKSTGQTRIFSNKGLRLTQEVKDEFLKLQDNDTLTLRNFKVSFACETPDRLVKESFVFKILQGEANRVEEKQ